MAKEGFESETVKEASNADNTLNLGRHDWVASLVTLERGCRYLKESCMVEGGIFISQVVIFRLPKRFLFRVLKDV